MAPGPFHPVRLSEIPSAPPGIPQALADLPDCEPGVITITSSGRTGYLLQRFDSEADMTRAF